MGKSLGRLALVLPPACIRPSRIERPTEIYGRLCLIQLYALQDEACTSMCLSDAIQHERIAVRRVRGSDCWLTGLRCDGRQGRAAGWTLDGAIVRVLEEKIASPASPVGLSRRPDGERLAQTAHVIARNQPMALVRRRLWRWNPVHIPQHSCTYLRSLDCSRKACWRRSLSRSAVISAHPEDQQCRLPGPTAVTPRAMDSFATPAINLELTQPAKALGSTMGLFQAGIEPCASVLHHTSDCPGKRFLAAPVTQRKNKRRLLQWRVTARDTRPVRVPGVALGREAMRQGEKSIRLFRVCGVPSRQFGSGGLDD
ncbi:uncharacterized protein TrAtP1_003585 [Trichoderma atroviride]|uniref:uncharacterized protein n=1 Tax=Hypocrea atroviridis TaxID=63577 RepID=UPI00332C8723|nr:hypothetical protein TrAtP1_003585 [Trichoderma atroviride]